MEFNQFHNNKDKKDPTVYTSNETRDVYIKNDGLINIEINIDNNPENFKYTAAIGNIGDLGGTIHVSDFTEFLAFVQKRTELKPLPKRPKDIIDWLKQNPVKGFDIKEYFSEEVYFLHISKSPCNTVEVPKVWELNKQIEYVQTIIKFWS